MKRKSIQYLNTENDGDGKELSKSKLSNEKRVKIRRNASLKRYKRTHDKKKRENEHLSLISVQQDKVKINCIESICKITATHPTKLSSPPL